MSKIYRARYKQLRIYCKGDKKYFCVKYLYLNNIKSSLELLMNIYIKISKRTQVLIKFNAIISQWNVRACYFTIAQKFFTKLLKNNGEIGTLTWTHRRLSSPRPVPCRSLECSEDWWAEGNVSLGQNICSGRTAACPNRSCSLWMRLRL